jgi:hypothetical protein
MHNPHSEFNAKVDAPIEVLPSVDSEQASKVATDQHIENKEVL